MKLLFVHQRLGEFGGAEVNIRVSAAELQNRGHTLGLVHLEKSGHAEGEWRQLFDTCYCLPPNAADEQVQAVLRDFSPDLIYLHNLSQLDVLEAFVTGRIPTVRMVHDHALYCMRGYKYNYFTRKICTRAFSPYCMFPCLASIGRAHGGGFPLKWVSYSDKKREISLTRRCKRLVVYSDYLKTELVNNGFPRESIEQCVPIRVSLDESTLSNFSQRNLILFAGQLIRGKGVDFLLQALAKVKTHFECAIVGDGSHRRYCEGLAAKLGLNQRVHFHGYQLPAEMGRFYSEASVFAMGSLWPEPFGMAGPEAMRFGLPVVAFDAGGIREWLSDGENGYLIAWKNVDLFAARLEQLLRDKTLARRLGQRAFEIVQRYDLGRQIDRLEQIFRTSAGTTSVLSRTDKTENQLPVYE